MNSKNWNKLLVSILANPKKEGSVKHPKCLGYSTNTMNGIEYDCGYNTTINCEDCRYCLGTGGRKNPQAKINQAK